MSILKGERLGYICSQLREEGIKTSQNSPNWNECYFKRCQVFVCNSVKCICVNRNLFFMSTYYMIILFAVAFLYHSVFTCCTIFKMFVRVLFSYFYSYLFVGFFQLEFRWTFKICRFYNSLENGFNFLIFNRF